MPGATRGQPPGGGSSSSMPAYSGMVSTGGKKEIRSEAIDDATPAGADRFEVRGRLGAGGVGEVHRVVVVHAPEPLLLRVTHRHEDEGGVVAAVRAGPMRRFTEAARGRLGQLLDTAEGAALILAAEQWARDQGVVNPSRMLTMSTPGFVVASAARRQLPPPPRP